MIIEQMQCSAVESMLGKVYCEKEREVNFLQKAKPEQYFITFNFINLEPQSYVIKHKKNVEPLTRSVLKSIELPF